MSVMSTPIPATIKPMTNFSFRQEGEVQLLVCEPLERLGFKNAFSTRLGGVSPLPANALSLGNFSHDERANVIENRRRFLAALNSDDWPLVTAKQIHSADIRTVADVEDALGDSQPGDALTANLAGIFLAIQTADCMPVLIADQRTRAFAAIHAGWRGTVAGVAGAAVTALGALGAQPGQLRAVLGPSIGPCCFEVQADVAAEFARVVPGSVQQRGGRTYVDLWQTNRELLLQAGLAPAHIDAAPPCTHCDPRRFYSYRRDGAGIGQHLAFILGGS